MAWTGTARTGKARRTAGEAWQGTDRRGKAWCGWRGLEWRGAAWNEPERCGAARRGKAGTGAERKIKFLSPLQRVLTWKEYEASP
jgi:hypothetical protein